MVSVTAASCQACQACQACRAEYSAYVRSISCLVPAFATFYILNITISAVSRASYPPELSYLYITLLPQRISSVINAHTHEHPISFFSLLNMSKPRRHRNISPDRFIIYQILKCLDRSLKSDPPPLLFC